MEFQFVRSALQLELETIGRGSERAAVFRNELHIQILAFCVGDMDLCRAVSAAGDLFFHDGSGIR